MSVISSVLCVLLISSVLRILLFVCLDSFIGCADVVPSFASACSRGIASHRCDFTADEGLSLHKSLRGCRLPNHPASQNGRGASGARASGRKLVVARHPRLRTSCRRFDATLPT